VYIVFNLSIAYENTVHTSLVSKDFVSTFANKFDSNNIGGPKMSNSILIIGATGSVGFEVAQRLDKMNERVKIAVRDPERAKNIMLNNVDFIHFEYGKPETFNPAFENVEKVLLVSPPSYLNIQDMVVSAIDSAISMGVKLLVNVSAISVESKLDKPMKQIEDHIRKSNVDSVFLRPNFYMQNFKDLFRDLIIEEHQISVPADNAKIGFVDIRDVADVALRALTDDNLRNNTYKLTGKQSLNLHVVAHLFSEGLNMDIDYISVSDELFEKRLKTAGWPASTVQGTVQLCSHMKNNEAGNITQDIEKILGREPIKFEQFVNDYSDNWA